MKSSFILYNNYLETLDCLTNEQMGELFRAILVYENGGEPCVNDGAVMMAFRFIAADLDKNRAEYEAKCNARSDAGRQGGRPKSEEKANAFSEKQTKAKKANAFSEKQTKAKKADNDNDNDDVSPNGDIYIRVVDALNHHANKSFSKQSTATRRLIDARLNEGYDFADFEKVIANKSAEWRGTEFEKFLRPQTLFGTKFESYLNQREPRAKPRASGYEREYAEGELESLIPNAIDSIVAGGLV